MRICCTLTSYLPAIGGAQLHTHRIVRELMQEHDVRIVSLWDENRTDWLLGTTLRAPTGNHCYAYEGVPVCRISPTRQERTRLLVPTALYYAFTGYAIDRISEVLVPKIRASARGCDLIHNGRIGREPLSYASLRVAREQRVPFVFVPYHHPRWVGWRYRHYLALYRQADVVIALTEVERHTLVGLGVSPERIVVTGMGPLLADQADGQRFRQQYGLGTDPIVLFVGQQYQYKGIASLLAAKDRIWASYPFARMVFIGPPTRYSYELFKRISDSRIINLGMVDLQTKTDAIAACDVLCVPSVQESFGGVYTEAWMLEKPVIGGNIPAVRDVITHGVDGYVVDQNPRDIAERVNYLLSRPDLRSSMGRAGHCKAEKYYNWGDLARKTEAAYRLALSRF